jgi:malate permease and related proteins
MESIVWKVFQIVFPIYACVGLGYFFGRVKVPWDSKSAGWLVLNVGLTCLVIAKLAEAHATVGEIGQIISAGFLAIISFFAISYGIVRLLRISRREYWASFSLSNMSIGMALGLYAYGNKGLSLALGFAGIMLVFQFTLGVWIPSSKVSFRQILRTPFFYGLLAGLSLAFTHTPLPKTILNTLNLIGGLTIPLILLTLGVSLAGINLASLGKALKLATIHLMMVIVVGISLAYLLPLKGEVHTMFILLCLMPSSTVNLIMAQQAGIKTDKIASFIFGTNILIMLSLPIALGILIC